MSSTDRQNRLLVAEDWKRIYQSFRNADFQSYDFDNLRRTMINYLRRNYPEDFNDYIESSEYLALIDLIAYLGQNISFRIDLNARENFLELAERRESILRLARLLSYNPKRNQSANGLLKFQSVNTTETVIDSNGVNLQGQTVLWNDSTNTNWYEQFIKILNAALPVNGVFGKPNKKDTVSSIQTEQYKFNAINTDIPVYKYSKQIDGQSYPFEVTSVDLDNGLITEEIPLLGNSFAFLYRNDSKGAGSSNNGFFAHFRQGALDQGQFSVTNPTENQTIDLDVRNVNNTDLWLYKLNSNGLESEYWTRVDSTEGNNVIYNSVNSGTRTIYSAVTKTDDRVGLVFADGVFGDLPKGNFRVYYRTSANRNLTIKPAEMTGISIVIPYLSKTGKTESITITMDLQYTVSNGSATESNASIKASAPRNYYTQNRMITAEDYNVAPLSISQDIIKTKAVNRTSSGISRFYDLTDATGKYSNTNLFATDGILYRQKFDDTTTFTFSTRTDVEGIVENTILPILSDRRILNYYLSEYSKIILSDLSVSWQQSTSSTNQSTGIIVGTDGAANDVATFTSNKLKNVKIGSLIKFTAPAGYHFATDNDNALGTGAPSLPNQTDYIWSKVVSVIQDGTVITNGVGPIVLNDVVPTGALLSEVRLSLANDLTDDVKSQLVDQVFAENSVALRFDADSAEWKVILANNIDFYNNFSLGKAGDTSNQQLDSSWLVLLTTDGETYTIKYRLLRYVFESTKQCRFYFDDSNKIYDTKTSQTIKDQIKVLNVNHKPDSVNSFTTDYLWETTKAYRDAEGYIDSSKIEISFFDSDDDGVVDNPQSFVDIVEPDVNTNLKNIFLEKYTSINGTDDYRYLQDQSSVEVYESESSMTQALSVFDDGQVFYFTSTDTFSVYSESQGRLNRTTDYLAYKGRDGLRFQYVHNADDRSRIDPSSSNLIDLYVLTKNYDTLYRQYLQDAISTQPLPPSSDQLFSSYGAELSQIKSISDEVIYHPVKYKPLFGRKADSNLQAVFKVVKNSDLVLNDNDIKTRVIDAVNQFFSLENWEFGETFYFSELSAYVMQTMSPDITTFVLVPVQTTQSFGSLYEIKCESDEIFINSATVDNISIIDSVTASKLRASGSIITSTTTTNSGITSSTLTNTTSSTASYTGTVTNPLLDNEGSN